MSSVKSCRNKRTRVAMLQLEAIINTNIGLGDETPALLCENFTHKLVKLADQYSPNPREIWT
jgi:hypothetical protein